MGGGVEDEAEKNGGWEGEGNRGNLESLWRDNNL